MFASLSTALSPTGGWWFYLFLILGASWSVTCIREAGKKYILFAPLRGFQEKALPISFILLGLVGFIGFNFVGYKIGNHWAATERQEQEQKAEDIQARQQRITELKVFATKVDKAQQISLKRSGDYTHNPLQLSSYVPSLKPLMISDHYLRVQTSSDGRTYVAKAQGQNLLVIVSRSADKLLGLEVRNNYRS